jgi:hypothetical protein
LAQRKEWLSGLIGHGRFCRSRAVCGKVYWNFLQGSFRVIGAFQADKPQMRTLRRISFHGIYFRIVRDDSGAKNWCRNNLQISH